MMHISGAAGHDPEPEDVSIYRLQDANRTSYCLDIGGFDLYGSLTALTAVVDRAGDLLRRERLNQITAP